MKELEVRAVASIIHIFTCCLHGVHPVNVQIINKINVYYTPHTILVAKGRAYTPGNIFFELSGTFSITHSHSL